MTAGTGSGTQRHGDRHGTRDVTSYATSRQRHDRGLAAAGEVRLDLEHVARSTAQRQTATAITRCDRDREHLHQFQSDVGDRDAGALTSGATLDGHQSSYASSSTPPAARNFTDANDITLNGGTISGSGTISASTSITARARSASRYPTPARSRPRARRSISRGR